MKIKVRRAKKSDFERVFDLIKELAHFEKLKPPSRAAKKRLFNDAFNKNPLYFILVSELGKNITGYAFYFFTYSSFLARKTLYLEDIYVTQNVRSKGTGQAFFKELLKIAQKEKCGRMEWCVLDWNKNAIKFYDKLGAKPLQDWIYYRLTLNS
ncbi:MAG TPA: GNAT family N-acetyltransferase [Ignavibacteria bacterium]|jgi:GNAT superfamily N-acetyltransferase